MFLKAVVSPAFVGGPVLDSDGFVIGVLSETDGIGRAGAVPVYRIEEAVSSTERT